MSSLPDSAPAPPMPVGKVPTSHELLTCTIRDPPHSYAHLEFLVDADRQPASLALDELQVRAHCASALRQFLGATGAAVPVDVLAVSGREAWVRVPREDLAAFAAGATAWAGGVVDDADGRRVRCVMRLRGCSDWLGSLVSRQGQARLWR